MPSALAKTTIADHRLGFRSLEREIVVDRLQLNGEVPAWLSGTLLRTGPAQFEVGGRAYRHWFDGLAMLHRFSLDGGRVSYASRFLESRAFRAAQKRGRISFSEFATDPCRTLFQRVASFFSPPAFGDNANVNVTQLGDEFLAMTETPLPVSFDPHTLETLGVGEPAPGQLTVAHPHRSPTTGELVSYATHFGPLTTYRVFARGSSGQQRTLATLPVTQPAYMHSFAVTERFIVLVEFPLVAIPAAIPLSQRPFIENYRWRPRRGTRFRVIELDTGRLRGTYEGEAFFAFHHVNAFERDGELVIDLCAYEDAEIVRSLYLENLRRRSPTLPDPQLRRCRVQLATGRVEYEPLTDIVLELPRIDYARRNGHPYRYVYGASRSDDGDFLDQIAKVDTQDGSHRVWREPGSYPGEPVFVRDPRGEREDDGVLLAVTLDARSERSYLLVLDARNLAELARATVPHAIPFGFHGHFARQVQ
jgi:beta,beta-carotene 9',10'-dioxygenase